MPLNSFFKKKKAPPALNSLLMMGGSSSLTTSPPANGLHQPDKLDHKSSISSIAACHSHRNVKPCHQMLIAESLFDPNATLNITSKLSRCLRQVLEDSAVLPYFVQFMEARGTLSKHMIRFWIQAECLQRSQNDVKNCGSAISRSFDQQFVNDAVGIFEKYLAGSAVFSIKVPDQMVKEIEQQIYNPPTACNVFANAQQFVISKIESEYFDDFVKSIYFCKYQVELLTSSTVFLADVLFNDFRLASDFIEFMELEGMRRYVDFLIAVNNYKKTHTHYDDAVIINNKFFSSQPQSDLEFSDKIKSHVQDQIESKSHLTCFDKPAAILIQYFEKTYLKQFLESQFYYDYLSQCISSIQNDLQKKVQKHKRTGSESSFSSESSFVSSTGHHEEPSADHSKLKQVSSNRSLLDQDPESMWRRDLSGKLQIAYVDEYGKVTRELEPEPEKPKTSSAISKAMKILSGSAGEKDKEDMAWQVAQMIVNDVCKVTLAEPSGISNS